MERLSFAHKLLHYTFGLVPIVAGIDKFTNLLTDWEHYLHPSIAAAVSPFVFMRVVGVLEIGAGILVLSRPAIGARMVALWLILIAVQIIASGTHFDVAVRDLVMAISAYVLYILSVYLSPKNQPSRA